MLIPCVTITLTANNNQGFARVVPAYYAKAFAKVWAGRYEPGKLEVIEFADDVPDNLRYLDVPDVASAERMIESFFVAQAEGSQAADARRMLSEAFPNGLRGEIADLIRKDVVRAAASKKRAKAAMTPHKSFLDLGLSPAQACACQGRGWANAAELPDDLVALAEIVETPVAATELLEKLQKLPKAPKPV